MYNMCQHITTYVQHVLIYYNVCTHRRNTMLVMYIMSQQSAVCCDILIHMYITRHHVTIHAHHVFMPHIICRLHLNIAQHMYSKVMLDNSCRWRCNIVQHPPTHVQHNRTRYNEVHHDCNNDYVSSDIVQHCATSYNMWKHH